MIWRNQTSKFCQCDSLQLLEHLMNNVAVASQEYLKIMSLISSAASSYLSVIDSRCS